MVNFIADNIISSLGFNSRENFEALKTGLTGISMVDDHHLYHEPFPASRIDNNRLKQAFKKLSTNTAYTRLEQLMILSISDALSQTNIRADDKDTAIIISTTKGNIDLLEGTNNNAFSGRELLWKLGETIGGYFQNPNVTVISNACISGVMAIQTASMLIKSGQYRHIIVCGGDIMSKFVVSGFMSFLSLSNKACKPFDAERDGLSLGEGVGTTILSKDKQETVTIGIIGGATANDANHISGPSRTGEGSFLAIEKALKESQLKAEHIDHISAHGTATPYNDEMESIAINRHQMAHAPVNSLKGFWGHTLGAAGIIETAALLWEMRNNLLLPTAGFENLGVTKSLHITKKLEENKMTHCLKMASGFGGCNAAIVVRKEGGR